MLRYEDKCEIVCNDNDVKATGDVMQFKPEDRLIVAIAGNKIQLNYNGKGMYIGNKLGMEFISRGPKQYEVNLGRQR